MAAVLKLPDIRELLKEITSLNRKEFVDMSERLHKQLRPFNNAQTAQVAEIKEYKKNMCKMESKMEKLEQHGRRDRLHIAGIPKNSEHDDSDIAFLINP